jgi:hypothetical protein
MRLRCTLLTFLVVGAFGQRDAPCSDFDTCDLCIATGEGCEWCVQKSDTAGLCRVLNATQPDVDDSCNAGCSTDVHGNRDVLIFVCVVLGFLSLCIMRLLCSHANEDTYEVRGTDSRPLRHVVMRDNTISEDPTAVQWECPLCFFTNSPSRLSCVMCGISKDSADNAVEAAEAAKSPPRRGSLGGMLSKSDHRRSRTAHASLATDLLKNEDQHFYDSISSSSSQSHGHQRPASFSAFESPAALPVSEGLVASLSASRTSRSGSATGNGGGLSAAARERTFSVRRVNKLNQRQKVSRRRRQWERQVGHDGVIRWGRAKKAESARGLFGFLSSPPAIPRYREQGHGRGLGSAGSGGGGRGGGGSGAGGAGTGAGGAGREGDALLAPQSRSAALTAQLWSSLGGRSSQGHSRSTSYSGSEVGSDSAGEWGAPPVVDQETPPVSMSEGHLRRDGSSLSDASGNTLSFTGSARSLVSSPAAGRGHHRRQSSSEGGSGFRFPARDGDTDSEAPSAAGASAASHSHASAGSLTATRNLRTARSDTFGDEGMESSSPGYVSQFLDDGRATWAEAGDTQLGVRGDDEIGAVDWEGIAAMTYNEKWIW